MTEIADRRAAPFEPPAPRPSPTFAVVAARARPHAAAPTLVFEVAAADESGLDVYTVALTAQIVIEPARRRYDDGTRELLAELFGAPERWSSTTENVLWAQVDVLVPSFRGETVFELPVVCNYDLEVAATKYFYAVPDGEVPLVFHLTGSIFYRGEHDRLQVIKVPWSCSAEYRLPVAVWKKMIEHHYPGGGWIRVRDETLERLQRRKAARGIRTLDDCVAELLEERE